MWGWKRPALLVQAVSQPFPCLLRESSDERGSFSSIFFHSFMQKDIFEESLGVSNRPFLPTQVAVERSALATLTAASVNAFNPLAEVDGMKPRNLEGTGKTWLRWAINVNHYYNWWSQYQRHPSAWGYSSSRKSRLHFVFAIPRCPCHM